MNVGPQDAQKLYQQIARRIAASIEDGRYAPGDRLPSERELADDFRVSRPTIRDAMIALEFQGLVEARQGSGVYVKAAPQIAEDAVERDVSALELAEARRLFEGEACALAAAIITEEQVARLDSLIAEMTRETVAEVFEKHELEFHLTIARATGNAAITATVEDLWTLRRQSSGCAAAMRRARTNSRGDFVVEHQRIAGALRARDPKAARQAMHGHLAQVIDDLLGLAESDALEQTREKLAEQRRMLGLRTEI
jgi:GntR family transcriptional regulator, hexuronate regulon transcriptional repressor